MSDSGAYKAFEIYRYYQPEWNNRVTYLSKDNVGKHPSSRKYFSKNKGSISKISKNSKIRRLIKKRRESYLTNRDPRYSDDSLENGWDSRAGVTAAAVNHKAFQYRRYEDGGLHGNPNSMMASSIGTPAHHNARYGLPQIRGQQSVPRHNFLRKYSRAPVSPFLAQMNGFEVPPPPQPSSARNHRRGNQSINSSQIRDTVLNQNYWRSVPQSSRATDPLGYYYAQQPAWNPSVVTNQPPQSSSSPSHHKQQQYNHQQQQQQQQGYPHPSPPSHPHPNDTQSQSRVQ